MDEKERATRRLSPGGQPAIFHDASVDLLLSYFESHRKDPRVYTGKDRIAEFFLVQVFDLLRSIAYLGLKESADGRLRITDVCGSLSGGEARLLEKMFSTGTPNEMLHEVYVLLGRVRERYFSRLRSPMPGCWEQSLPSWWRGDSRCASYRRCLEKGTRAEALERCGEFYPSWRNTSLSLPRRERPRTSSAALADEIYDRCGLLEFFTVRLRLEEFLADFCVQGAGSHGDQRSVYGLVVRLLTMFSDHCLGELNTLLEPVTGNRWYFVNVPGETSH